MKLPNNLKTLVPWSRVLAASLALAACAGFGAAEGPTNGLSPGVQSFITNAAAAADSSNSASPAQLPVDAAVVDTNSVANAMTEPADPSKNLKLNFRGVPLDMVLNYLSDAAGFIIVLEAQPRGRVDVWSSQPVSKDEAVDLLNTVLHKNGYAAIRKGRTLSIVNRDEAKIKGVPVRSGSKPESIPDNDEIVTQIIPVRFVEVAQLIKDLQPLVSVQTAMTANESGNAIVITDTQSNIRRVAEIIQAIDSGAEDVTEVRVFRLQHSDPLEMTELLMSLFPDDSRSGSSQSPVQFGGFRGFFDRFRGTGGPSSSGSGGQNQRIKKRARVLAVADQRTSSVVVSASKDLIEQLEQVVTELDANPARQQTVRVFPLQNADPQEAMQVLEDIFQKNTTVNNNRNNANRTSNLQNRGQQQQQNQQGVGTRNNTGRSSSSRRTALQ